MRMIIDGVEYIPMPEREDVQGLQGALEVRFDSDAGDNLTVREYLRTLLETLWDEQDGFSGKRPFGNSGWEYDLYEPLASARYIDGTVYADGSVDLTEAEKHRAHTYVRSLIRAAFDADVSK